nr:MAG TPA: hypothetical protein [Caudoviricetes sp.]
MGTLSFDIPPNCRWIIHNGHLLLSFFVPPHTVRPAGSIPAFRSKLPPHYRWSFRRAGCPHPAALAPLCKGSWQCEALTEGLSFTVRSLRHLW